MRPPAVPAHLRLTRIEYFAVCALIGLTSRQEPLPDQVETAKWCFGMGRQMALEASKPVG